MQSHSDILNTKLQIPALENVLLFAPELYFPKPLKGWIEEIKTKIETINSRELPFIMELFNEAIMLFIFADQLNEARELCYSQIQLCLKRYHHFNNQQLLSFAITPWLKLITIERLEGNDVNALNKLNMLLRNNDLNQEAQMKAAIEKIKILLSLRQYDELIHFIKKIQMSMLEPGKTLASEALCIALANSGQTNEAIKILKRFKNVKRPLHASVMSLRLCELLNQTIECKVEFFPLWTSNFVAAFYVVQLLKKSDPNNALKLLYYCLERAYQINDEIKVADCLVQLYALIDQPEGKNIIENLMIKHYFITDYQAAHAKMLHSFNDLKHVERQMDDSILKCFYEELLMFSDFC